MGRCLVHHARGSNQVPHSRWTRKWGPLTGKTPFPEDWSSAQIMHEISDIATDPAAWDNAVSQGGRTVLTGWRNDVQIRVIVDNQTGEIITGHPTNLPRNP